MDYKTKGWAVVMFDGFIPDFSVKEFAEDILQIHSSQKGAQKMAAKTNEHAGEELWFAVPCTISYSLLSKAKKVTKRKGRIN